MLFEEPTPTLEALFDLGLNESRTTALCSYTKKTQSLLDSRFVFYSVVIVLPVGLVRFELTTPRLSSVCSNQLSYRPSRSFKTDREEEEEFGIDLEVLGPRGTERLQKGGDPTAGSPTVTLLRLHPSYQPLLRDRPPYG